MQRLRPLSVPWQVSPSTPFLRLIAAEASSDQPTQVGFVGHFALRDKAEAKKSIAFSGGSEASNPYEIEIADDDGNPKAHAIVKIEFDSGLWVRISPSYSDRQVLDPEHFDDSLLPGSNPPEDVQRWLNDFQSLWLKSGTCPDPGAYVVEQSGWKREVGAGDFTHYLIEGHDAYIEVLAQDWKWEEVSQLPDWW